ncbi:hypothetical protein M9Y10_015133 [Tritrichomonas musculus]|uniref:Cyclic nucleotide-binding domain-containing protein n=1 Tax=Tritrichomonas musculus TaxID=1915356 RepID=A0ABR2L378_9EUKA
MHKRGASFNYQHLLDDNRMLYTPTNLKYPIKQRFSLTFSHSQKLRRFWEYLIFIVCLSTLIEISFFGIFINDVPFAGYSIFIIFDLFYIFDIFVYLHTSYFSHGVQINNLRRIKEHIGCFRIVTHIIAAIPLSWIGVLLKNRLIYLLLCIPRILRIQRGLDASYTISQSMIYSLTRSRIFQSILLEILCIHLFACIFYLSAFFEGIDQSWVKMHEWDKLSPTQQYVVSIYFVMTTILAIGFGDLTPKISQERIIVIFIQLIGVMVNGFLISTMVSSLFDPIGSSFLKGFRSFIDFMQFKEIPRDTVNEVINFFQEKWSKTHGADDLKEVFKFVPQTVRNDIKLDITKKCLSKISMMQIASQKLLIGFSNAMFSVSFVPGEIIIKQGEIVNKLYLFKSGIIKLFVDRIETEIINCDDGVGMGEIELLIDQPRKSAVVAVTYVEGWVIERDDLLTSIVHQKELQKELIHVCKTVYPEHHKDVRKLIYGMRLKPKLSPKVTTNKYLNADSDSDNNINNNTNNDNINNDNKSNNDNNNNDNNNNNNGNNFNDNGNNNENNN